jgi:chemotaxis protein histidine kinase CheA
MWRSRRRREVAVTPSMAPVSPTSAESDNPKPKPGRSASQDTPRVGDRKASPDPLDKLDPILALLAGGADPEPLPRRWPKFALFAACLAVLAAGWWFYRNDAGGRIERTIRSVLTVPTKPNQAVKPTELDGAQQAELPSRTYEELLAKERSIVVELEQKLATREKDGQLLALERARTKELEERLSARQNDQQLLAEERQHSKELEEKLATRQNDQQLLAEERQRNNELEEKLAIRQNDQQLLAEERQRSKELEEKLATRQKDQQSLAQARARIKELEQQVTAREQPPPVRQPTTSPAATTREQPPPVRQPAASPAATQDSRNTTLVYRPPDEMPKPQPTVRRTGPKPLPEVTQPMPRLSLQASDLTYNPAGYWQVTATLNSNTSRALDARIQCSFVSAGRQVGNAEFGPTSVAPGEQISADLIGPPTTAHVDSTTCHLLGQ